MLNAYFICSFEYGEHMSRILREPYKKENVYSVMYFPDDVWRYIVELSLPTDPPWKRCFRAVVSEMNEALASRRRPVIIYSRDDVVCLVRNIRVGSRHVRLHEHVVFTVD